MSRHRSIAQIAQISSVYRKAQIWHGGVELGQFFRAKYHSHQYNMSTLQSKKKLKIYP